MISNIAIDLDRHGDWPMLDAWLNQVVVHFEQNAMRPETSTDKNGNVTTALPGESAISTRIYSTAVLAETTAEGIEEAVNISENNFNRMRSDTVDWLSNTTQHARREATNLYGDLAATGSGLESIRENKLVEWFQNCYECRGRIETTLSADISFPELVTELGGHLIGLGDLLDLAMSTIDSGTGVQRICVLLQLGDWCIPDLIAFKAILDALLHQYFLLNIQIGFDWWDLISLILRPVLRGLLSLGSMSLQMVATPIRCIQRMLTDLRLLIDTSANIDAGAGAGFTLNQFQTNVNAETGEGSLHPIEESHFSETVLESLLGKTEWTEGDTLIDFSDILASLSPVEIGLLSLTDFNTRLQNMVSWLASKLEVLKGQNDGIMQTGIRITSVMMSVRRLNLFIDVIIRLLSQGKQICVTDSTGRFVPTEPIETLFAGTGLIPPWITLQEQEDDTPTGVIGAIDTQAPTFTIIDTSLGTEHTSVGCLGRVSEEDQNKVKEWINQLDQLSLD